jgi:hypothetical protein
LAIQTRRLALKKMNTPSNVECEVGLITIAEWYGHSIRDNMPVRPLNPRSRVTHFFQRDIVHPITIISV